MSAVRFAPGSFNAVVSFYAIIHLPIAEQRALFARIRSWLKPKGVFIAILGHETFEGIEPNWLGSGRPMFWSHTDAATYRRWLNAAGFTVNHQEFVPEGGSGHELFWAVRRPGSPRRRRP